jgi:hypothetical protein
MEKDCPGFFVQAVCPKCGTHYIKRIYCSLEWCPVCGAEWSDVHKRRFGRWWEKVCQMGSVGYFVFTIPERLRARYKSQVALRALRAGIIGILKARGYQRGLSRFHWFGDHDPQKWNPHLNTLVDEGHLANSELEEIKNEYRAVLGLTRFDPIDVYYKYVSEIGYVIHVTKYCTRATFHDVSTEELEDLAWDLKGFRNTQCWGGKKRWEGPEVQIMTERDLPEADEIRVLLALEKSLCPACGGPLAWERARGGIGDLAELDLEELGGGYAIARVRKPFGAEPGWEERSREWHRLRWQPLTPQQERAMAYPARHRRKEVA